MEQIKVTIDAKGGVSYTVQGVKGKGCKELTKAIDALGTVSETKNTSEFCEIPVAPKLRIGG